MKIIGRNIETFKSKTFTDLKIGDTLYCLFGGHAIVPIVIRNIIRDYDSSITFVGSKERLIGHEPPWAYNLDNINWRVDYHYIDCTASIDASTTIQEAKKLLRRNIAFSNKAFRNQYVKKMLKS